MRIQAAIAKEDKAAAKEAAKEASREAKAVAKEVKKEKTEARKEHGVGKIEGKSKTWWEKQNITILKQQAEFRGHRFNDLETKGGTSTVQGVKTKINKFKKKNYLKVLLNILKL